MMSQLDETVCKGYFIDPEVLEEYKKTLNATTSTMKERFCRRFCRWLGSNNEIEIPLTSESNIMLTGLLAMKKSLPPQIHEIAALYRMLLETPFEENDMSIDIDYDMNQCCVSEVYKTWRRLARKEGPSFPLGILPTKTCLRYKNGTLMEWFAHSPMLTVNHDGTIVKNPHSVAYEAGKDRSKSPEEVEKLVRWAYSIEAVRPPKYVGKFLNRKMAAGLSLSDALDHAYADNWGIVSAILENHQFSASEKEIWDAILYQNIDYASKRLKHIRCAIQQFINGYKNFRFVDWNSFFSFAILDPDAKRVFKLMKAVTNYRGGDSIMAESVASSIVRRYSSIKWPSWEDEHYLLESVIDFFAITQSSSDTQCESKRKLLIEKIGKELKVGKSYENGNLEWLERSLK